MKYFVTILAKAKFSTNQYNYLVKAEIVVKYNRSNYPYWVTDSTFETSIYSINKPKIITAEKIRKIILDSKLLTGVTGGCNFISGYKTLQEAEKYIMKELITLDTIVLEDDEDTLEM